MIVLTAKVWRGECWPMKGWEMLNISPDLPWEEYLKVMNQFVMRRSGYPSSWRAEAVSASIQTYDDMAKNKKKGNILLFRPRGFMEEERRMAKLRKLKGWHKAYFWLLLIKGWGAVYHPPILADAICEQPLIKIKRLHF